MEFKSVKAVDFEEKSAREIEQELIDKHEETSGAKQEEAEPEKVVVNTTEAEIENKEEEKPVIEDNSELDDERVLSHIRKRFNRDDISYDNLLQKETIEAELPEDLEALRRYKKETGRGISDFVKLNRDIDSEDPDAIIAEYISIINPEFDGEDVEFEMDDKFSYDEDMDDERDIKSRKLAKKKTLAEARKYLTEQKEKYKAPLESREGFIPEDEKESYSRYKSSIESQNDNQEKTLKQSEHFSAKTNELFSSNFEGFGYKVGDSEITFKVNNAEAVKKTQSDAMNFIGKHLDENGMLKDAKAYHKALNAAMDPDALFKFAYEKGATDAIEKDTMEAKNIEMKARSSNQVVNAGSRVREVDASHGSGLTIKSSKNKN